MIRTEVLLSEDQVTALKGLAKRRHLSLADLIREGINHLLRSVGTTSDEERRQRALAVAGRFRSGLGDLSRHHNAYLEEPFDS